METDELTQEAFDKLRERVQVLEELIFVEMKLTADRTDISACEKVDKIKAFIEQVREEEEEEDEVTMTTKVEEATKDASEAGDKIRGNVDPKLEENVNNLKRPAPADAGADESPEAKAARLAAKMKDLEDGGEGAEGSDEEGGEVDCCVVCGLHRGVFKEDTGRELHHYLSHGFNILKEFDILKPDDSIFLICNICNSPFPRKCHVNFRKHLVGEHTDRIIDIFREV